MRDKISILIISRNLLGKKRLQKNEELISAKKVLNFKNRGGVEDQRSRRRLVGCRFAISIQIDIHENSQKTCSKSNRKNFFRPSLSQI